MPTILDKFAKASISTDVAIATTVKTARLAGVAVLEAFDLSKYPLDTPVFVVTYKKTTDPLDPTKVIISQLRSWKALVNPGANTLTNLTIQPGYNDDIGNAIGDFIECIPTSAWVNSLIDGLRTSINDDGTLKTSAVQQALNISNTPSVGWNVLAQTLTPSSAPANGEFVGNFNGDVTSILSRGMKLLIPRTGVAATQCMSFTAASSQYATKAAPTNLNVGTAFGWEAWVYVKSYNATSMIISRTNTSATDGWYSQINANGQFTMVYTTGGNATATETVPAVPTGRWVHLAAMVSNTATRAVTLYMDGQVIASRQTATAATSLTNSGNFTLGRWDNPNQYSDIYMAEVRLWGVARSAAEIQNNKDISMTGGEANLLGLWQGNGNFNDKTASANNLVGSGGAIATQLMSAITPRVGRAAYQNQNEYVYVTKVGAFAGGVTPVTMFGGMNGSVPFTNVGTIQYSGSKTPFGFPVGRSGWAVERHFYFASPVKASNAVVWREFDYTDWMLPIGCWDLDYNIVTTQYSSTSANNNYATQLSPQGVTPFAGSSTDKTQHFNWQGLSSNYFVAKQSAHLDGLEIYADTNMKLWAIATNYSGGVDIYMERNPAVFAAVLSWAV